MCEPFQSLPNRQWGLLVFTTTNSAKMHGTRTKTWTGRCVRASPLADANNLAREGRDHSEEGRRRCWTTLLGHVPSLRRARLEDEDAGSDPGHLPNRRSSSVASAVMTRSSAAFPTLTRYVPASMYHCPVPMSKRASSRGSATIVTRRDSPGTS